MKIISHRGYWKQPGEKNTSIAFERSFQLGFGTETDIRDFNGSLVISHDVPKGNEISFAEFLKIYKKYQQEPLALNIKADGLQDMLSAALQLENISNCFFFDMSVPDMLGYIKAGLKTYTRQSEYEPDPSCYKEAHGIWLDAFHDTWYDEGIIQTHIDNGKTVAIVSADLHKRNQEDHWRFLKSLPLINNDHLILCTDFPEDALSYFNN